MPMFADLLPAPSRAKGSRLFADLAPPEPVTTPAVGSYEALRRSLVGVEPVAAELKRRRPLSIQEQEAKTARQGQAQTVSRVREDLSEIGRAMRIAASEPGAGSEWYDRLRWIRDYGLTLGGRIGPKGLRQELLKEASEFTGFGPALAPMAGDALTNAIQWGVVYPKLFKLTGGAGAELRNVPRVKAALDWIEKAGGLDKLAAKYPARFKVATDAFKSFAQGFGAGSTVKGVELLGKDKSALEAIGEMTEQGVQVGSVAAIFSAASSIDKSRFADRLRQEMTQAVNQRYQKRMGELPKRSVDVPIGEQVVRYPGKAPASRQAAKALWEQYQADLRRVDNYAADVAARLDELSAGKMYRERQEDLATALRQARRFALYGYQPDTVVPKGRPGYVTGMGKQPPFIEMPTTRVGEAAESVREFVGRHLTPHAQPIRVPAPPPPEMRQLPPVTKPVVGPVEPVAAALRQGPELQKEYAPPREAPGDLAQQIARAGEADQYRQEEGGRMSLVNRHIAQYQRWSNLEPGSPAQRQAADQIYQTIALINRVDRIDDPVDGRPFVPPEMKLVEQYRPKPAQPPELSRFGAEGFGFTPTVPPAAPVTQAEKGVEHVTGRIRKDAGPIPQAGPLEKGGAGEGRPDLEQPAPQEPRRPAPQEEVVAPPAGKPAWDYRMQGRGAGARMYDAEGHKVARTRARLQGKTVQADTQQQADRIFRNGGTAIKPDGTAWPGAPEIPTEAETAADNTRKLELGHTTSAIKAHPAYKMAEDAMREVSETSTGLGTVYIPKEYSGEIESYAGENRRSALWQRITHDPRKGQHWDDAAQELGWPDDLNGFLERFRLAVEGGRPEAILAHALKSQDPELELLAQKQEWLQRGEAPADINAGLRETADELAAWNPDLDKETLADILNSVLIKGIEDVEAIEGTGRGVAGEVPQAPGPGPAAADAGIFGQAIFRPATGKAQGQLGLEFTPQAAGPVAIKAELGKAVGAFVQKANPKQIPELGKKLKDVYLEFFVDKPELFHNPTNAMPEMQEAWDQATKGRPLIEAPAPPAEKKPAPKKAAPKPKPEKRPAKYRAMAETVAKEIEAKRGPMTQNATPKRLREYHSRLWEADNLDRLRQLLLAMADAIEAGTLPAVLEQQTKGMTKKQLGQLVHKGLDHAHAGYYDVIPLKDYYRKDDAALAAQKLIEQAASPEQKQAQTEREKQQDLERLEEKVRFQKIPGFFATPAPVIKEMLDAAHLAKGDSVLEPSAGKGDIAEAIHKQTGRRPDVAEIVPQLQKILKAKGYETVFGDFLELKPSAPGYDKIVMNPPFEKGQDVAHVRHAYDLLKPGGRIVALMSEGVFFNSQKKFEAFRDWFAEVEGSSHSLAPGAFQGAAAFRTTGVRARLVTIDKPAAEAAEVAAKKPETKRMFAGGGAGQAAAAKATKQSYGAVRHSEAQPAKTHWHALHSELPKRESFNPIRDALEIASPAHVGGRAREGARILRLRTGEMAHEYTIASETLKQASKAFHWLSQKDAIDFIDRMERGLAQRTPQLDEWAGLMRRLLDQRRDAIQALGKGQLEHYYENYFPHIWREPGAIQRLVRAILGKRNLAGPKSFLKKRTIPFFKDGIERGLEPVSWNPVDLVLLKLLEMDKYLMCQKLLRSGKARGMFRFVSVRTPANQRPDGWRKINDNAFTVFLPPEMTMEEAYDGIMVEQLMHVAQSLGIDTKRFVHISKRAWGYATWPAGMPTHGPYKVRTKYASPESVLAHEIGHVLGAKYDLYNVIGRRREGEYYTVGKGKHKGELKFKHAKEAVEWRQTIDKEWRALADARFENAETTEHFRHYVREAREKEAVLLQAYLTAPDKFRELAPKLYGAFRSFLDKHAELRPLVDLKASLLLEPGEAKVKIPGLTTLGHWYAPKEVARLINNYLSPGLWNNENKLVSSSYNLTRMGGNALNMVQLGVSLFHAINITTDTVSTVSGLGLRQLTTRHQRLRGLANFFTAPVTGPARAIWSGVRLKRAYRQIIDDIEDPRLRQLVVSVVAAGGRDRMSPFYYNQAIKALQMSLRQVWRDPLLQKISAGVRLPVEAVGAIIEALAWPLMGWYVPTVKLGAFAILAQHEMDRAQDKQISNEQLWERLVSSWDSVDNRMGELVYDNLFWNRLFRDVLIVTFRSTGWNLGSWREFGGIPVDIATTAQRLKRGDKFLSQKMVYGIGSVLTYSLLGGIVMYLLTGRRPQTAKDYLFPQTGRTDRYGRPERLSFPTYAKDWYAWADDPTRTLANKLHPMWGVLSDFARNEDFFGTEIRDTDDPILKQLEAVALYAARQFVPISIQKFQQMQRTKGDWDKNLTVAITGIQPAPSYIVQTPARKLMGSYLRKRTPKGGKSVEQGERSDYRRVFINRLRRGEPVDQAEAVALLGPSQVKAARKEARLGPFAASFRRLSLAEALNVYVIANDDERRATEQLLRQKFARADATSKTSEIRLMFRELMQQRRPQLTAGPPIPDEAQSLADALAGFLP